MVTDSAVKDFAEALSHWVPGARWGGQVIARQTVQRLLGYWFEWHLAGGLDQLIEKGWQSKSAAYRQRNEFRAAFGIEVEDFLPEVAAQLAAGGGPLGKK